MKTQFSEETLNYTKEPNEDFTKLQHRIWHKNRQVDQSNRTESQN